jgi:hypothetical protein
MKSLSQYFFEALISNKISSFKKRKEIHSLDDLESGDYFHIENPAISRFTKTRYTNKGYACIFKDKISDNEYTYYISIGDINSPFLEKPIFLRKAKHNIEQSKLQAASPEEYELLQTIEDNIDIDRLYNEEDGMLFNIGCINEKTLDIKIRQDFKEYIKKGAQNIISEALVSHKIVKNKTPDITGLEAGIYLFCKDNVIKYICYNENKKTIILICHETPIDTNAEYEKLDIMNDNANIFDLLELLSILERNIQNMGVEDCINIANEDGECKFNRTKQLVDNISDIVFELKLSKGNEDIDKIKGIMYVDSLDDCQDFNSVYKLNINKNVLEKIFC